MQFSSANLIQFPCSSWLLDLASINGLFGCEERQYQNLVKDCSAPNTVLGIPQSQRPSKIFLKASCLQRLSCSKTHGSSCSYHSPFATIKQHSCSFSVFIIFLDLSLSRLDWETDWGYSIHVAESVCLA